MPFFCYFVPKQVVDDVWRSTVRDPAEPSTGWWWGTWIATNVIGFAGYFTSGDPTSGDEVVYQWIITVVVTVAVMFWIRVVRTVSHAQDALAGVDPPSGLE